MLDPSVLSDIAISVDGEIIVGGDGDFSVVQGTSALLQNILFRTKTVIGDYVLENQCGASLETLIGLPNSQETGQQMEALITKALTHDGFLSSDNLDFITQPINLYTILCTLIVTYSGLEKTLSFSLDLREGLIGIQ